MTSPPLTDAELRFARRAVGRRRLFLALALAGVSAAILLGGYFAYRRAVDPTFALGVRAALVVLILLNARQNLRQYRYATLLEKLEPGGRAGNGGGATIRSVRAFWRNPFLWAFLIGIVTLTLMRPLLRHEPPPPPVLAQLPSYSLVDSTGRAFGSSDLAGQVYVVDFIFTRCASICPQLTRAMATLERRYDEEKVSEIRLVSISVDPDYDTPQRLSEYASSQGLDTSRWSFLTGERGQIAALLLGGFKVPLGQPETVDNLIDVAHTGKFVLVDRQGGIRGYYDSDETGLDEVYHRSRHVLKESG